MCVGVAIALKAHYIPSIYQINRFGNRITESRLKTGYSIKNVSIFITYSPNTLSGQGGLGKYRNDIDTTIKNAPNNVIKIWRADNNGPVARTASNRNSIGKWAIIEKTDKGNGVNIVQKCIENDMARRNAYFIPKNNDKQNLATWNSYYGAIAGEIGFCIIQRKYGNWAINVPIGKYANPSQATRREMLKIGLRIKLGNLLLRGKW